MSRIIIDANKSRPWNLSEITQYKDLLYLLAYRDIRIKYAQTALGFFWVVFQPIITVALFTFIFGYLLKIQIPNNIPYPLFAFSGMVSWTYFSVVLTQSSQSIIGSQNMVQKIYFPKLILPLSKAFVGLVDFILAFIILLVLILYYEVKLDLNILFLPFFLSFTILFALGMGIWISALTIRYRDFQQLVPFILQIGLYATPVAYPSSLIGERFLWIYYLNPMAGIVEGFRWSILDLHFPGNHIYLSYLVVLLIFISGLFYFRKTEEVVADII